MTDIPVNVDNFARAETDRMFGAIVRESGGINQWTHRRVPTPLDNQTVIRMNRETLYSASVADISAGATVVLPDGGDRYVSVMVVNQDHYINRIIHEPGEHQLTMDEFDTPFVLVGARILVDPGRPGDVDSVNALQDKLQLRAAAASPFSPPQFDQASHNATRTALLELAQGLGGFAKSFGTRADVDPVRHLIGSAAGWGGLPESEAYYVNVNPGLPVGHYRLTVRDVPVDAFWSISLYNAEGFFEPNDQNANSVNSITAACNPDGSVTVNFGGDRAEPNSLPIMDGWNYLVRLYRPHPEIITGSWTFPGVQNA